MLGGTLIGWLSQSVGRRLSILVMCVMGGALIYPYTYVSSEKVMAVAFFEQFAVQGKSFRRHSISLTAQAHGA